MDRLNKVHRASRVQLPKSIIDFGTADVSTGKPQWSLPIMPKYAGIICFMVVGGIVIATASLLALSL